MLAAGWYVLNLASGLAAWRGRTAYVAPSAGRPRHRRVPSRVTDAAVHRFPAWTLRKGLQTQEGVAMPRVTHRATAAFVGIVLAIGLPTGFVLAAGPADRHGVEVSAIAKVNAGGPGHGAVVSSVAKTQGPSKVNPTSPGTSDTHPANHGADVSAVARDHTLVGGKHNNHGGAVSVVAHKH